MKSRLTSGIFTLDENGMNQNYPGVYDNCKNQNTSSTALEGCCRSSCNTLCPQTNCLKNWNTKITDTDTNCSAACGDSIFIHNNPNPNSPDAKEILKNCIAGFTKGKCQPYAVESKCLPNCQQDLGCEYDIRAYVQDFCGAGFIPPSPPSPTPPSPTPDPIPRSVVSNTVFNDCMGVKSYISGNCSQDDNTSLSNCSKNNCASDTNCVNDVNEWTNNFCKNYGIWPGKSNTNSVTKKCCTSNQKIIIISVSIFIILLIFLLVWLYIHKR